MLRTRLFWKLVDPCLRYPRAQRLLDRFVTQAQQHLGVGSGVDFVQSGEVALLHMLLDVHSRDPNLELTVFDVGANQGQYARFVVARLKEVATTIHCFEPSPTTFSILQGNCSRLPGVILNPFGLGNNSGEFQLYSDSVGSGLASLTKRRLDHVGLNFNRTETVRLETLDGYCESRQINRIDLLKLDVEGHELDVLAGAERMFAERRVRFVTFEFGGCNIDTRTYLRDYWHFFADRGMKSFHRLMPYGRLFQIDAYSERLELFGNSTYLVELPTSIDDPTRRANRHMAAAASR